MLPHFNFVIYQHIHDISYHICNSNCNENDNFVSRQAQGQEIYTIIIIIAVARKNIIRIFNGIVAM